MGSHIVSGIRRTLSTDTRDRMRIKLILFLQLFLYSVKSRRSHNSEALSLRETNTAKKHKELVEATDDAQEGTELTKRNLRTKRQFNFPSLMKPITLPSISWPYFPFNYSIILV